MPQREETSESNGPDWSTIARWAIGAINALFVFMLSLTWQQTAKDRATMERLSATIEGQAYLVPIIERLDKSVREMEHDITKIKASRFSMADGLALRQMIDEELKTCCYQRRNGGENPQERRGR